MYPFCFFVFFDIRLCCIGCSKNIKCFSPHEFSSQYNDRNCLTPILWHSKILMENIFDIKEVCFPTFLNVVFAGPEFPLDVA